MALVGKPVPIMAPHVTGPSMEFWNPIMIRAVVHILGLTHKPTLLGEWIYWATLMFPTLRFWIVTEILVQVDGNVIVEVNNIYFTSDFDSRSVYRIHNFQTVWRTFVSWLAKRGSLWIRPGSTQNSSICVANSLVCHQLEWNLGWSVHGEVSQADMSTSLCQE